MATIWTGRLLSSIGQYALPLPTSFRLGYQTPINLTVPSVRTVDRLVRAVFAPAHD